MKVKKRDRPYVAIAVLLLVSAWFLYGYFMNQADAYESELARQYAELTSLENDRAIQQAAKLAEQDEVVSMVTGVDTARKESDDARFQKFITRVTTWGSYQEYRDMGRSVMEEYGLNRSGSFYSRFLNSDNLLGVKDASGYSCAFVGMDSTVAAINAGTYSYFTTVTCRATGPSGASRNMSFVCTYDVTVDGTLTNVGAYIPAR